MPILFRCPGELRHITRGFLYDQRDFADADKAKADGWFDTLEEAAGLVPVNAAAPAKPSDGNSESIGDTKPQEAAAPSREALIAALEAFDVEVDKRWGEKRLAAELAKAKGAQDAA